MKENKKVDSKARISPLFKWPGGKRWLVAILKFIINKELKGTYYEPFLGAGAVFLHVHPKKAFLSDINNQLINCLQTVLSKPDEIACQLHDWKNTKACYYKVRNKVDLSDPIYMAVRFLYLMQTCWGGVYRINRKGHFNVPYGKSKRPVRPPNDILKIASVFSKAKLKCLDFETAVRNAKKGDVVYADPPYTTLGANNGFVRYNERLFAWADQERLARVARSAKRRGVFVAVSGFWHQSILNLYPGWWAIKLSRFSSISRTSKQRRNIEEILLLSRKPKATDFSKFDHVIGPLVKIKRSEKAEGSRLDVGHT
jgi:DNA adenine methylase